MAEDGWSTLFAVAFQQSRNPMVLVDAERAIVDVNGAFVELLGRPKRTLVGRRLFTIVAGGPTVTPAEWRERLREGRFVGEAKVIHADLSELPVQWAAATEMASGRHLVLFVVLSASRWGARLRRAEQAPTVGGALSAREREVVHLVARGHSGPEIASELGIGHETVRTHVRNAMGKLGARSRAHLVAKALTETLAEPAPA